MGYHMQRYTVKIATTKNNTLANQSPRKLIPAIFCMIPNWMKLFIIFKLFKWNCGKMKRKKLFESINSNQWIMACVFFYGYVAVKECTIQIFNSIDSAVGISVLLDAWIWRSLVHLWQWTLKMSLFEVHFSIFFQQYHQICCSWSRLMAFGIW